MDDWEDAPVSSNLKKELYVNKWADEDVDENDIKDSWEDEEEPTPAPTPVTAPSAEKSTKKTVEKAGTKKEKTAEVAKEEVLDPAAEKSRQQRLVEEADLKLITTDLFGKTGDEKSLDNNFIPKSESDFLEYAELISHKLRPYEKSYHYMSLLKTVMRLSVTSLTAADVKDIGSSVMAISNEKLKAEKEAIAGKKKTAAKKKQLNVHIADDEKVPAYDEALDDDYDFM